MKVIQPGNRPGLIYNIGKSFQTSPSSQMLGALLRVRLSFGPMQESVCGKEKVATETRTL